MNFLLPIIMFIAIGFLSFIGLMATHDVVSEDVKKERALLDSDHTAVTVLCGPKGHVLVYENDIRNGMTNIRTTIWTSIIPYSNAQIEHEQNVVRQGIHRHVPLKVLRVLIKDYNLTVCDFWSPTKALDDSFVKIDVPKQIKPPYLQD